jgi:hypothetical protein
VNRTFGAFTAFPKTDYSNLPTVSFIIPNNLHNAHGSNEKYPWAGSPDEENNDILRKNADDWLRANIDAYLQWAKVNNSLLIVTQDEERWTGGTAQTITTVVHGDADLFNPGTNSDNVNHYNLLRTITDMYGLAPLGVTGNYAALDTDASGQLSPDGTPAPVGINTTTAVASSAAGSIFGQTVTFTATVTPASGSVMPTGIVTFKDGATTLGTGTLNSAGIATLTLLSLAAGSHSITAVYGGSTAFNGSTSPVLTQAVSKASSSTALTASLGSSVFGQSVTFTATVTGQGGSVTFMDGATSLGAVAVNGAGQASLSTASLGVASHSITAVYSGGTNHNGSTSAALAYSVNKGSATATVTASASPSTTGQPVTFTATIASLAPGAGVPTGTVQFQINGVDLGLPVALVNGLATSAATSALAAGSYTVTAVYSGSANHNGTTSALTHVVSDVPVTPPPSNSFAGRTTLVGAIVIATGSNVGATKESNEPRHAGNRGGKSVWWTWTAPVAGSVTIDTLGSSFDTLLAIYTGSSVGSLTKVAANDEAGGNTHTSKVTFTAVAGRVYQIAVDGYRGESGSIVLRIHTHPKVATAVAASDGTFSDRVTITWGASIGATAYEVWRNPTSSTSGATKISLVDVTGTTFDDTTAVAGQTYWYFVKAKNAVNTSAFSAGNSGYRSTVVSGLSAPSGDSTNGGLLASLEDLLRIG